MDADRWQQITRLYHEALERPVDQRDAFLDACCQGDNVLRGEVASLLAHEASAEGFLADPAAQVVADLPTRNSEALHVGLEPGVTLGTYQIERRLGRGGMGVVFLAHDTTLHRRVALKVLGSPTDDGTARARLLREARNAAALNHPNICTVHEVGEANGRAFIAMEYVEGRPLSDRLAASALPLMEVVRYGIEVADALAYAHDHGVIHRDLKAANTIVTTTGRLKLVDFGLARREDALLADATTMPSLAAAGVAVGTPYAMAPEQVRGGVTDARTDIWALGVLLYEMVSGAQPFTASTIPELFSSILRDAPAPLPHGVSADLRMVIERCLERQPDRRYQRADEVRAVLEAIQTGTTPAWGLWRARIGRRPWLTVAAGALAIVTLLVGGNVGGVRERLTRSPPSAGPIKLAVLPFENLTGDPEQEYFSDGLTEEMITQLGRLQPQRLSVIARTSSMQVQEPRYPNRSDWPRARRRLRAGGECPARRHSRPYQCHPDSSAQSDPAVGRQLRPRAGRHSGTTERCGTVRCRVAYGSRKSAGEQQRRKDPIPRRTRVCRGGSGRQSANAGRRPRVRTSGRASGVCETP